MTVPMARLFLGGIFLALLMGSMDAKEAKSSKLIIPFPASLAREYKHLEAMFGTPQYGGSISQNVYYIKDNLCHGEADIRGGYPQRDKDSSGRMKPIPSPFILMVDSGGCSPVTKARNAQHSGASGVLIANLDCVCSHKDCEGYCVPDEPSMPDDGSGMDISIPAFLLFKQDADPIKEKLKANVPVLVEMSWNLPSNGGENVKYEVWTVPTDQISKDFYQEFALYADKLERTDFQPHLYLQNGLSQMCQENRAGERWCETGCTNQGHYCAIDPDHDVNKGLSGGDVVEEGLRRQCIHKTYGEPGLGNGYEWWSYVAHFSRNCGGADDFVSRRCIENAFKEAGIDKSKIDDCIQNSGGLDNFNNTILEEELRSSVGVVVFPTMRVNGIELRGSINGPNVFGAICSAFEENDQPAICQKCLDCLDRTACVQTNGKCSAFRGPTTKSGGVSVGTFLFTFLLLVGAGAGAGFWYYKKTREEMRDRVRDILAEYMPLEDQPDESGGGGGGGILTDAIPSFSFAMTSTNNDTE